MDKKNIFKTRPATENAKDSIVDFFSSIKTLTVALSCDKTSAVVVDGIDYFYKNGEHIAVISHMSALFAGIDNGTKLSGYYQEGFGKMARKLYAQFGCEVISADYFLLRELALTNPKIAKMISHGAMFIKLGISSGKVFFNPMEIYDIDDDLTPSFAKFAPNGEERFENSRHLLMTYLEREVIFSVIIKDGIYYCLAKEDSFKMQHIKSGGVCNIFDGADNCFQTVIKIMPDKKDEIFANLKNTNNDYFKENKGLVCLSFQKS